MKYDAEDLRRENVDGGIAIDATPRKYKNARGCLFQMLELQRTFSKEKGARSEETYGIQATSFMGTKYVSVTTQSGNVA